MIETWTKEEIFFDAPSYFERLESDLSNAKRYIDLETYIFATDTLGRKIADSLIAAANRGVRVRVVVDGFGSPRWSQDFLADLIKANIDARIYHPLPWGVLSSYLNAYPSIAQFFKRLSTMNERNHRKVCIVDRNRAWVGGMNISASHLQWRDTGVLVGGRRVRSLLYAFGHTWKKSWGPRSKGGVRKYWHKLRRWVSQRLVRLNSNYRARQAAYSDLLKKIDKAKKCISITNAYFVPPQKLLTALKGASKRGVEVRIIVPRNPDVFFMHWVSSAFYFGLLESGVRIFEYLPVHLHAKTLIIDDWAIVGTSNLNHRSIIHDLEVDIVLTASQTLRALANQFEKDLKEAQEVSMTNWKQRSLKERIAGRFLLFFRYWI